MEEKKDIRVAIAVYGWMHANMGIAKMSSQEVAEHLNKSIRMAFALGDSETWYERTSMNRRQICVYPLDHFPSPEGTSMYCVVRDDARGRPVIIRVITREKAEVYKAEGQWSRSAERTDPPESWWCEDCQEHHLVGTVHGWCDKSQTHTQASEEKSMQKPDDEMLVIWQENGHEQQVRRVSRSDMQRLVRKLAVGPTVPNDTIEVYQKQPVLIAVDVKVEVG